MRAFLLYPAIPKRQITASFRHSDGQAKRWTTSDAAADKGRVIFEAIPGKAVRMLKFMSLTGSIAGCTATGGTWAQYAMSKLDETDLTPHSLMLASVVSVLSTVLVTKMFGPFVTRVTMLPPKPAKTVQINKHGLPTFDSILSTASKKAASTQQQHRHLSLSGRVTSETELVIETPGLLGFTTRHTRLSVRDLQPSGRRSRTWDMAAEAMQRLNEKGIKTPVTTFTILWKSAKDSPDRQLMEEINSIVGSIS
ncbi:hypothetical protein IW140_001495 [Coemansia sp. RSA 1813]|nr:hypothetical protein EV178_003267 [Coemansia sp. RSA 1646]KAJ1771567.1 hypothetical protein LPJ74_002255 [Coemansia sp. RSA 1843]KAJ2089573.1 hypothetical protein IW138_003315 [Coemansia sp. RSA 986]KAJ2214675.1 hypothetical protein EV179_002780 [Coemansia sp. RSA 487]KAJ2571577.1 hypothetical protein IW140_001495 [Coemansia sp. RSA 1813]